MKNYLMSALAVLGLFSATGCKAGDGKSVEVVAPKEFAQKLSEDSTATLLDVRCPDEYSEGHLKGAVLMDWLDRTKFEESVKTLPKGRTVYVYCRSGRRSNEAAKYLTAHGFKVIDMRGGYLAWTAGGLETTK